MKKISAILITKNEEGNVGDCLASLTFADEVIVVDSGSMDRTEELCRRDPRVRWFTEEWKGYGPQKNSALEKAAAPWVFSIDADERVTPELAGEIRALDLRHAPDDGFRVSRRNFFGGKWVRRGGWYPDYVLRLWRKDRGRFDNRVVHESVLVPGTVGTLSGELLHFTYRDTADFLDRMNRYSTLAAREMARAGKRCSSLDLLFRPAFTFFRMFVLKRGFLDGALGFRLAVLYAAYTFAKYAKLGEADGG
jgi:glycosyltransferase involved in cell wall biosynthesis